MTNNNQHIPSGYKPSPLGPIPEDWEVKRLGDCFDICAGRDLITEAYSPTQTVKHQYPIFSNSLENKGLYGYTSIPRHKANSITITGRGSLGHAEFREQDFDAIIRLLVLTPKIEISCELIANYINFSQPFIYESTGVPQLTAPQIQNTKLLFPPYEEQLKIMDVLHNWDTAIAKQTALIEKLTLRKRGLMQQLLTGKKRLKGFGGEWKEVRLGEICPMERGEMLTSDNYLQGNIPVIAGGKEPAGFHSYANRQKNTITISCSGASAGFVSFHDVPIFATDCFTISESNAYNVWFIYHVLTNLQEKIYKLQTGGAQPHVHPKDVYPMKIHIPSINEQNAIASVLVNADKEIEIQKQKLAALQEEKKGLMQVLLTGKKRIR